jgi:hypothetical protein
LGQKKIITLFVFLRKTPIFRTKSPKIVIICNIDPTTVSRRVLFLFFQATHVSAPGGGRQWTHPWTSPCLMPETDMRKKNCIFKKKESFNLKSSGFYGVGSAGLLEHIGKHSRHVHMWKMYVPTHVKKVCTFPCEKGMYLHIWKRYEPTHDKKVSTYIYTYFTKLFLKYVYNSWNAFWLCNFECRAGLHA